MDTSKDFVPGYHDIVRPEIEALIPLTATRILDLGCGTGALGSYIKQRQKCIYTGIEINKEAIKKSDSRIDHIFNHDLNDPKPLYNNETFDCMIFADVLEHLLNPMKTLKHYANALDLNGTIIASLPNIAHPSIAADLARNLFRYTNAGILDRTHLRFFTITSAFQMFSQLNLKITKITHQPSVDNPVQMLITAKPAQSFKRGNTASIIIPSAVEYKLLRATIGSIRTHTDCNVRIIVVNNALPPEATEWIEQQNDILEIRCSQNTGFTTAINLGLEISDTPYIVIANDDILVTKDWLKKLIRCACNNPKIGIVGPTSNRVSGPQIDPTAKYQNETELAAHASKIERENKDQHTPFPRIVFFCTLIKKKVIEKIGHLDEIFSPGNFEDDDYCLRSLEAGFTNTIDRSTFIHHHYSQTFNKNPEAYKALLARNKNYFERKWGTKLPELLKRSSQ